MRDGAVLVGSSKLDTMASVSAFSASARALALALALPLALALALAGQPDSPDGWIAKIARSPRKLDSWTAR